MTYTISQFGSNPTPNLGKLDQNFQAAGVLTPIPCSVAGTNALVMTQNSAGIAASWSLEAYQNYVQVCGIAAASNTGAVTAQVGTLAALPVYKDTAAGPAALTGGEINAGNAFTLRYDSALNSGNGGWHLVNGVVAAATVTIPRVIATTLQLGSSTPTLTAALMATATLTYTALVPNSGQDQTFTVAGVLSTDALMWNLPQPSSVGAGLAGYFVAGNSTVGTLGVRLTNSTANATITLGAVTVNMRALRFV